MKAHRKYRDFHGREPRGVIPVEIPYPGSVVLLGRIVAVEYETDKYEGGGDGTMAVYRHEFDSPAALCCDPEGRVLYIIGDKVQVDDSGIRG